MSDPEKIYKPPKPGLWFMDGLASPGEEFSVLGDFEEEYNETAHEKGLFRAQIWFWRQVVISIVPFIFNSLVWSVLMFKNYLKIVLRNSLRQKMYSFINIFGLALGMASFLLIMLYVYNETHYDAYHTDSDNIYRIVRRIKYFGSDGIYNRANTGAPVAPLLKNNFTELSRYARMYDSSGLIQNGDKFFYEKNVFFADPELLNIFTFTFIAGNRESALSQPNSVILTEETARKYFGEENPVGKYLTFENVKDLKVTAVVKKNPTNSHFHFDFLASFSSLQDYFSESFFTDNWDTRVWTYAYIEDNVDTGLLGSRISDFLAKHTDKDIYESVRFEFQPVRDIHLHSDMGVEVEPNSSITYIYLYIAIAVTILVIACINFMNLATARSAGRAREVGVRKTFGAYFSQLMRQFFAESLLISFFSLCIAVVIVLLVLPDFSVRSGQDITINGGNITFVLGELAGVFAFTGILAGTYPALFLSRLRPVSVLKGVLKQGKGSSTFRKALVVVQFVFSIALIISTIIIYRQLNYLQNKDLGFNDENVISVPLRGNRSLQQSYQSMKGEMLAHRNVLGVTASSNMPGVTDANGIFIRYPGLNEEKMTSVIYIDYDFMQTMGVTVLEGRSLRQDERNVFMINQSALKYYGWESAVGKDVELYYRRGDASKTIYSGRVTGMVEDFHYRTAEQGISPLIFVVDPNRLNYISIRLDSHEMRKTLDDLKLIWQKFVPDRPFEFTFLEEKIGMLYRAQQRIGTIFKYFTVLAVFIACLGLFGLAAFMAEQRTKEVAIRKVHGASTADIAVLLTKDFLKLVLFANILAWPAGYFFIRDWLQDFPYRVGIDPLYFIGAAIAALLIALLTVGYQALKAAYMKPSKSLKYE